jgi:uncharacterized protein (TIGR02611 family)
MDEVDRWEGEGGAVQESPEPSSVVARRRHVVHLARKVAVGVAGGAVLALGIALVFLPGPAMVIIPLGLAILATEFAWARRIFRWARERLRRAFRQVRGAAAQR